MGVRDSLRRLLRADGEGDAFRDYVYELKRANDLRAAMLESWRAGQPVYTTIAYENMVREGWRKNELIFACISKTANTAAQVQFTVKDADDKALPDHPVKRLVSAPNPFMNEYDFWSATIIMLKLAGAAYWEKERNRKGEVIALWPLRPDWVRPVLKSRIEVSYYEYKPSAEARAEIDPANLAIFRLWDPLGLFETYPPVAVAARVGDVDNALTNYLKLFFEKGGTPPLVLTSKQTLSPEMVESIRAKWRQRYGGANSWIDPAVLDADAGVQTVGFTFKDLGLEVIDGRDEARICMVFDIPPIIVGARVGLEAMTYSNYEEARRSWWQDSLMPLYANLSNTVESQLGPEFPDAGDVTYGWDFSAVPALQEVADLKWARATAAASKGLITRNEFRQIVGLPATDDGDVYLLPAQTSPSEETKSRAEAVETKQARARDRLEAALRADLEGYFAGLRGRLRRELTRQAEA